MNRTLTCLATPPGWLPRTLGKVAALAMPMTLLAQHAFAQAGTLGARMQAASTDLTTGGGYVLTILGYLLGGAAVLAGIFTIWQHSKNPNGQNRFGYGVISVLAGGAFLAASAFAGFSSQTISGGAPTNTGTAQAMQFK